MVENRFNNEMNNGFVQISEGNNQLLSSNIEEEFFSQTDANQ